MSGVGGSTRKAALLDAAEKLAGDGKFAALVLILLFALSLALWAHGLGPHDETRYIGAALGWLEDGIRLGPKHWDLRHLYILPMAGSFLLFGKSEFAATAPSILFAAGLVAITYYCGRRVIGKLEALIAAALAATSAFFVAIPIEVEIYGAEVFLAAAAIWTYLLADHERRRSYRLFIAGILCGLAWTLRESSIYTPMAIGLLVLWRGNDRLTSAVALSLGFGVVIFAELVFYYATTGNPFHRYLIDLLHRNGEPAIVSFSDHRYSLLRHLTRPLTDSLTAPFVGPFVLIAAACATFFRREIFGARSARLSALNSFLFTGLIGLMVCGYVFYQAMPNYYPVLSYALLLITAISISEAWRRYGAWAPALVFAAIFGANLVVCDFKLLNYYKEARFLVRYAMQSEVTVYTDSGTARRVYTLLALKGVTAPNAERFVAVADEPPVCALYFENHRAALPAQSKRVLLTEHVLNRSYSRDFLVMIGAAKGPLRSLLAPPRPISIVRYEPPGANCDD